MKKLLLSIFFTLLCSTHAMMGKNEKQCDKLYKVKAKSIDVKNYFSMGFSMTIRRYRMKGYYLNCFFYKKKCIAMEYNSDGDVNFSRLEAAKIINKATGTNYTLPETLKSTRLPKSPIKHEGKFLGKNETYTIAFRIIGGKISGVFFHSDSNIAAAVEAAKEAQ